MLRGTRVLGLQVHHTQLVELMSKKTKEGNTCLTDHINEYIREPLRPILWVLRAVGMSAAYAEANRSVSMRKLIQCPSTARRVEIPK
jgi:hypothetical protein